MSYQFISQTPLQHTYPYGRHDVEIPFGTTEEIKASLEEVFREVPECRRAIVAIPQGDGEAARVCEEAGLQYALDVQIRDGRELSLMIYEPDWVSSQSTEITDLELS